MVKKILYIIFAFLVLFSSTGFTLNKHFCGDEEQSASMYTKASKCCPDEEEAPNDCCKDETHFVQVEEDYVISPVQELAPLAVTLFIIPSQDLLQDQDFYFQYSKFQLHIPPLLNDDIPIVVQSFLC